jgi:hypothetical protein
MIQLIEARLMSIKTVSENNPIESAKERKTTIPVSNLYRYKAKKKENIAFAKAQSKKYPI